VNPVDLRSTHRQHRHQSHLPGGPCRGDCDISNGTFLTGFCNIESHNIAYGTTMSIPIYIEHFELLPRLIRGSNMKMALGAFGRTARVNSASAPRRDDELVMAALGAGAAGTEKFGASAPRRDDELVMAALGAGAAGTEKFAASPDLLSEKAEARARFLRKVQRRGPAAPARQRRARGRERGIGLRKSKS
jgi:hypothetical protein